MVQCWCHPNTDQYWNSSLSYYLLVMGEEKNNNALDTVICWTCCILDIWFVLLFQVSNTLYTKNWMQNKKFKLRDSAFVCLFRKFLNFAYLVTIYRIYFSSSSCSFFLWIDCNESFQQYFNRFPLSFMVSEIDSDERGKQKQNPLIWTFYFASNNNAMHVSESDFLQACIKISSPKTNEQ
jgi:hypothetical protein